MTYVSLAICSTIFHVGAPKPAYKSVTCIKNSWKSNNIVQGPDEWKLEQGLEAARLGIRNQSSIQVNTDAHKLNPSDSEVLAGPDIPDDPDLDVQDERPGWTGYVEWEDYPEKKAKAHQRFSRFTFPPPPEFQLEPLPATNPVLEGKRWKLWHKAIGGVLTKVPEISWETVLKVGCPSRCRWFRLTDTCRKNILICSIC